MLTLTLTLMGLMCDFAREKTYTPSDVPPGLTEPIRADAGLPSIGELGEPALSARFTTTPLKSTGLAEPLEMRTVTETAGPDTSPAPCAVASNGVTLTMDAVILPPNDAVADSETGAAVTTVADGTVWLTFPPPGAGTTVVGRVGLVESMVELGAETGGAPTDVGVDSPGALEDVEAELTTPAAGGVAGPGATIEATVEPVVPLVGAALCDVQADRMRTVPVIMAHRSADERRLARALIGRSRWRGRRSLNP